VKSIEFAVSPRLVGELREAELAGAREDDFTVPGARSDNV
jgi:hypothetical protein